MITAHDLDMRYPEPYMIWQRLSDESRDFAVKCFNHLEDPFDFLDRNEREKGRYVKEATALAPMTVIRTEAKPNDKGRPSPRVLAMSGRHNDGSPGTTLDELMALPEDDRSFLVYPIIPRSKISMLAGKSDVGKSMFYIQLCTAIILGRSKFLDMTMEPKYRRALIITTEDDRYDIRFRLSRQLAGIKLNKAQSVNLKVVDDTTEIVPVLEVELSLKRYDLVVIDAFGDVFEGNINATNDVRRFLTSISMVLNRYQCAALIIHHEGKASTKKGPQKDKILGSSGIEQRCRSVSILSADSKIPGRRTLQVVKGNHISDEEKAKVHRYKFDSETFTYSVDPNAVGEDVGNAPSNKYTRKYPVVKQRGRKGPTEAEFNQAKEMREAGKTLQEIGEALGRNSSTICRWFKEPPRWDTRRVGRVG